MLTAVDQNLSPLLISTGSEDIECIIVQVKIGERNIRIFNCYGPQEICQAQRNTKDQQHSVNQFWIELEKEVIKAQDEGCLVLIEMDANAKLGQV